MNLTDKKFFKENPKVAVLDSGIGGLSILNTLQQKLKTANFYYIADYQYFPYGLLTAEAICARLERLFQWVESTYEVDLFVIACNTASTSSLGHLRRAFKKPIVGVVPPIKLAAMTSQSKAIAVLATEQTAFNDYTKSLVAEFASDCRVDIIGSRELVLQAEAKIHSRGVDIASIRKVVNDLIDKKDIDAIALSCTHFPFLIEELESAGLKPKHWVLPNEGVAKRVEHILMETHRITSDVVTAPAGMCHIFLKDVSELKAYAKAFARISRLEVKAEFLL